VGKRYEAYGWHVLTVENGDTDLDAIDAALKAAQAVTNPTLIKVRTTVGWFTLKAGTQGHSDALGMLKSRQLAGLGI